MAWRNINLSASANRSQLLVCEDVLRLAAWPVLALGGPPLHPRPEAIIGHS